MIVRGLLRIKEIGKNGEVILKERFVGEEAECYEVFREKLYKEV